jgi:protoporphyrinogen oxidase
MHVAVMGAGITGLSAADELAQRGIQCAIYEKDATVPFTGVIEHTNMQPPV